MWPWVRGVVSPGSQATAQEQGLSVQGRLAVNVPVNPSRKNPLSVSSCDVQGPGSGSVVNSKAAMRHGVESLA